MSRDFDDVQRIVLRGRRWTFARHLMIDFGDASASSPPHFLHRVLNEVATAGAADVPGVQVSLGFTRRGLQRAQVPDHVLAPLALKAPAFWAGAPLRAAAALGLSGENAAERWDEAFGFTALDAVVSLHGDDRLALIQRCCQIRQHVKAAGLMPKRTLKAKALPAPAGMQDAPANAQWVHFGYRDGLSRVGIVGWTPSEQLETYGPASIHQPGEFVLGHPRHSGSVGWIAGPGLRVWPDEVRAFFHNGSFGVLHQMTQNVEAFERFVDDAVKTSGLSPHEVKGKLCGRYPDGRSLAAPDEKPTRDFDYQHDRDGAKCPFGSHVRRMNPRLSRSASDDGGRLAHFGQPRPLIRRGLPYGPAWSGRPDGCERGLMGQFFCASIEDQFEHLLGEWADRVPLGSPDPGGARDPLIGAHEAGDGPFVIPTSCSLKGLQPFTRTRGVAYLFYPSLRTLKRIADSDLWGHDEKRRPS